MEFNFTYLLSQALVILSYILLIRTYFLKSKSKIIIFNAVSLIAGGCAYILLGAWTGLAMSIVAILRSLYILQNEKHRSQSSTLAKRDYAFLIVFFACVILATIPAYSGPLSLLPVFSTSIYTYSIWQKNIKIYKFCGIPTEAFGVAYNLYIGSVFGVIMEAILLTAAAIGYIAELKSTKTAPAPQQA